MSITNFATMCFELGLMVLYSIKYTKQGTIYFVQIYSVSSTCEGSNNRPFNANIFKLETFKTMLA